MSDVTPVDVLAVAAHRDDVEQTCGGTLLRMHSLQLRTAILDLTQGEAGTRGSAEERAAEAEEAARILCVAWRGALDIPDGRVENTWENRLKVAQVIRQQRPQVVILPYWLGRHPDHYTAARLGYEGCFIAGLKQMPLKGEAFRPFKILYSAVYQDVTPSFAVDITAQFDSRRRAILAYKSQFNPPKSQKRSKVYLPLDQLEHEMNLITSYYGRLIGVRHAEPFVTREIQAVDDIVKIPVRSF